MEEERGRKEKDFVNKILKITKQTLRSIYIQKHLILTVLPNTALPLPTISQKWKADFAEGFGGRAFSLFLSPQLNKLSPNCSGVNHYWKMKTKSLSHGI